MQHCRRVPSRYVDYAAVGHRHQYFRSFGVDGEDAKDCLYCARQVMIAECQVVDVQPDWLTRDTDVSGDEHEVGGVEAVERAAPLVAFPVA